MVYLWLGLVFVIFAEFQRPAGFFQGDGGVAIYKYPILMRQAQ